MNNLEETPVHINKKLDKDFLQKYKEEEEEDKDAIDRLIKEMVELNNAVIERMLSSE